MKPGYKSTRSPTFVKQCYTHQTFRKLVKKGTFQWMKNSMEGNPPPRDSQRLIHVSQQGNFGVKSHTEKAFRKSCPGLWRPVVRPCLTENKGRATDHNWERRDSFLLQRKVRCWIGSGCLNCAPNGFWEWGPTRVRVQRHLTWAMGKCVHSAHTTCQLPSHPQCPLTSQRDRPPAQGWQDEKGGMGGKKKESRNEGGREGCASGWDKDVREIKHQRNK